MKWAEEVNGGDYVAERVGSFLGYGSRIWEDSSVLSAV